MIDCMDARMAQSTMGGLADLNGQSGRWQDNVLPQSAISSSTEASSIHAIYQGKPRSEDEGSNP